jgi:hypothetical protein
VFRGLSLGVPPGSSRGDLCPSFTASAVTSVTSSRYDATSGRYVLAVPRRTFQPNGYSRVKVQFHWEPLDGISRGAVVGEWDLPPALPSSGTTPTYEDWLAALGDSLARHLDARREDAGCGCDINVEVLPESDSITVGPCGALEDVGIPDDQGPDPPAGDPVFPLKALPPPVSGVDVVTVNPSSCDGDGATNPRLRLWCEFVREVLPVPTTNDDLLKGKTVVINFMYATCTGT